MPSYFCRQYQGEGKRVDRVLALLYPDVAYAMQSRLLDKRDVFVDGARVGRKAMVQAGQWLELYLTPAAVCPRVVYENADIVVVYKSKGIATQGEYSLEGLVHYALGNYSLMHRLDTNTDGLVLFAKNQRAYDAMYRAMQQGRVVKYYHALVWGSMSPCVLQGWLLKMDNARVRIVDSVREGAVAVQCRVVDAHTQGELCRLNIELHGGKTHQLRAQLAHCGHFIVGDSKYGDDRINRRIGYKKQQLTAYRMVYDGSCGLDAFDVQLNDDKD